MNQQLTLRLVVLLSLPPLMWAGNAVVGRQMAHAVDPVMLNALRWIAAFVLLLPLGWRALATVPARRQIRARWRYLTWLGLLGFGTYNALQYTALRTSTPVNVTLIASSLPVWTLLLGAVVYGTHPSRRQLAGAVLSFLGVIWVLARGAFSTLLEIHFVQGDLLMLVAIIAWASYSWMLARPPASMQGSARPPWNWAEFLLVQCLFGMAWNGMSVGAQEWLAPPSPLQWTLPLSLTVAYIAIGPSIIAYRCWGLAVAEAGPAMAALFNNLTPLFTGILSAVLIGEAPQPYHGVAFALILAGIAASSATALRPR